MFSSLEDALEWLDVELVDEATNKLYDAYPIIHRLVDNKAYSKRLPKGKILVGISKEAFDEARKALKVSMELSKVWEWDYDDYVKDAEADGREASEDDYYELLQIYTDDFLDQEFDDDLKTAMEDEDQFEWRDEYDFKHKMLRYQKEIDEYESEYEELLREKSKELMGEIFSNESS